MYLKDELTYIYQAFSKLGYPEQIINKVHSKIRRKFYSSMVQRNSPEPCPTRRLPLNNFTARYLKPTLRANNIRVVHPNSTSISSTLVRKRPCVSSSINDQAGVYIVPCGECNKCYVGQSGKILSERLGQHKDDVRLGHSNNSVFKHVRDTNHAINWENSKMVFSSNDPYRRLVVEAALI